MGILRTDATKACTLLIVGTLLVVGCATPTPAPTPSAKDPGVRGGPPGPEARFRDCRALNWRSLRRGERPSWRLKQ